MEKIVKNAIFNVVYKILNIVFPLVGYTYVARILLADGVGVNSAVQTNVSYFVILATLGLPAYGVKEIARTGKNLGDRNRIFSELFIVNTILTLVSLILFLLCVAFFPAFSLNKTLYYIYGISIILNFINVDWLYQGLEEYVYIAVRSSFIKLISLVAIFWFVKDADDVIAYAMINVLAISGNYFFNIVHAKQYVIFTADGLNIVRHFRPLGYIALGTISTELYARIDITMLDIMKNGRMVGLYTYSQKLINLVIMALVAVTSVFLPKLSLYFHEAREKFNYLLRVGTNIVIFISLPACIGIACISRPLILAIFGEDFVGAINCLRILALMIPLKCVGDLICYQVLLCAGKEAILMKLYILTMLINIISNLLLIQYFDIVGAATASLISELCVFILALHYSRKYMQNVLDNNNLCKSILSSVIMGVFAFAVTKINWPDYLVVFLAVIIGMGSYCLCNLLFKNYCIIQILTKQKNKY